MEDFFNLYFEYAGVKESETPAIFHRWSAISLISAMLGRNCSIPFGHSCIYPNQYIMIMGSPGTRKSTAINVAVKLLKKIGYTKFSSDKCSKERFLMDMVKVSDEDDLEDLLDLTLDEPNETYIAIGEFTDFIGQGNMEFVTMLTNLWDNPDKYTQPKIHGKSVEVGKPCVNILGGNTAQGFSLAFPPEALGNGFLSRLIFVHGEETGKRVTFPRLPDSELEQKILDRLIKIQASVKGEITISKEAEMLLHQIYQEPIDIEDNRFRHYNTRRFTHLLKLSLVIGAMDCRTEIQKDDVIKANTILFHAEKTMPKALGEFGKSRFSDISNSILDILGRTTKPMTSNEMYKKVSQDITRMSDLNEVITNLVQAGKIQLITASGKTGYMVHHEQAKQWDSSLIQESILLEEEL